MSDICLSISCLTNNGEINELKKVLETVKTKDVKKWRDKNIGETLLKKRAALYKENGGKKNLKKAA